MKKIIFILVTIIFTSMNMQANEIISPKKAPDNWIRVLSLLLSLDMPDIDYQRGTNKVIGGKRYECIDGGLCRIRTGGAAKRDVPVKELSTGNHLVIDKNGVVALLISKTQAKSNPDFNLKEGYYTVINTYPLKSIENCPKEFETYSVEANKRYNLEELENHYAIIIKG